MGEHEMTKCYQCGKYFETEDSDAYMVHMFSISDVYYICSPSCLVGFAWDLKERQPKLSKSKMLKIEETDGQT
jgi:hypothetical protein